MSRVKEFKCRRCGYLPVLRHAVTKADAERGLYHYECSWCTKSGPYADDRKEALLGWNMENLPTDSTSPESCPA